MGIPYWSIIKTMKWNQVLKTSWGTEEFTKMLRYTMQLSNATKLRDFQYRLLQRGIVTNSLLFKWKVIDSDLCTFCQSEKESIIHLFVECDHVQNMWAELDQYGLKRFGVLLEPTPEKIISNCLCLPKRHALNTVALVMKQYIYRQRCLQQNLNFQAFVRHLNTVINIEKYIAVKSEKYAIHEKKWGPTMYDGVIER